MKRGFLIVRGAAFFLSLVTSLSTIIWLMVWVVNHL